MIIRLGYVAISKALNITSSGTITYTNYLKEENKNEKLDKIIKSNLENLEKILNSMIDSFIVTHKMSKKAHEELIAMSHIDDEINQIFKDNELKMNEKIVNTLKYNNFNVKNLNEKVHIIIGLIDNFCHEIVYHAHKSLNYDEMKKEVINIVLYLLKD